MIVASCAECPFAATDVDTVYGHRNYCQYPDRGQRLGEGSRAADLPPTPPEWCGLRTGGPLHIELKKGV